MVLVHCGGWDVQLQRPKLVDQVVHPGLQLHQVGAHPSIAEGTLSDLIAEDSLRRS